MHSTGWSGQESKKESRRNKTAKPHADLEQKPSKYNGNQAPAIGVPFMRRQARAASGGGGR
jgi:hypothetical protein